MFNIIETHQNYFTSGLYLSNGVTLHFKLVAAILVVSCSAEVSLSASAATVNPTRYA